jgi:hypothetical protein
MCNVPVLALCVGLDLGSGSGLEFGVWSLEFGVWILSLDLEIGEVDFRQLDPGQQTNPSQFKIEIRKESRFLGRFLSNNSTSYIIWLP